ncbi:MAG: polysaccharide biosynthesis C-terminal domain-containing protein, partial [Pseudomonadota bacterium]
WPGFPGLAIATSVAAWLNAALLFFGLQTRGWYKPGARLISRLVSVTLASLSMGAALLFLLGHRDTLQTWVTYGKFSEVLAFITIGAAVYGIAAIVFGAIRPSDLKAMLRRKAA